MHINFKIGRRLPKNSSCRKGYNDAATNDDSTNDAAYCWY